MAGETARAQARHSLVQEASGRAVARREIAAGSTMANRLRREERGADHHASRASCSSALSSPGAWASPSFPEAGREAERGALAAVEPGAKLAPCALCLGDVFAWASSASAAAAGPRRTVSTKAIGTRMQSNGIGSAVCLRAPGGDVDSGVASVCSPADREGGGDIGGGGGGGAASAVPLDALAAAGWGGEANWVARVVDAARPARRGV
jgi:hypothetical protein